MSQYKNQNEQCRDYPHDARRTPNFLLNQSLREAVLASVVVFAMEQDLFKFNYSSKCLSVKFRESTEKAIINRENGSRSEKLFTVRGKERLQNGDKRFPSLSRPI